MYSGISVRGTRWRHPAIGRSVLTFVAIVVVLLGVLLISYFVILFPAGQSAASSSSSSDESTVSGVVAGYVTVGPSQPVCNVNESCTENLTGYSLEFTSQCGAPSSTMPVSCQEKTYSAQIGPNGHYSILLASGEYEITGLSPSCAWLGCSSAFPRAVIVEAGQQQVVNVQIDTGIR